MPTPNQLSRYYQSQLPNHSNIEAVYFWEGFKDGLGLVKSASGDILPGVISGNEIPGYGDQVEFIPGIPWGQIFVRRFAPKIIQPLPIVREQVSKLFVLMLANSGAELWVTGDKFAVEKQLSITLTTTFDFRKIGMAGTDDGKWMVVLSDNNLNVEESIVIHVFMGNGTGQIAAQTVSLGTTILAEIGVMGYGDFQVYTYDAGFTTDTVKLYSATPSGITEVATSTAAYFNGFFFFSPNADLVTVFFVGDSYNLDSAIWDYNYGYFLQFGGTDRVCLAPNTRVPLLNAPPANHYDSNVKGGFIYNVDNIFSSSSINLATGDVAMKKFALNISTNPATATLQETLSLSIPIPTLPVSPGARIVKYYPSA